MVKYDIPDLSEYEKGFPEYWLKIMFLGDKPDDYPAHAQLHSIVRLTEAAIRQYEVVRKLTPQIWESGGIPMGAVNDSSSNLEACVTNMHRVTRAVRSVRGNIALPPAFRSQFDKNLSFLRNEDRIRDFRDFVQHTLDCVASGDIPLGSSFVIRAIGPNMASGQFTIDRIQLGDKEIKFAELAAWLKEMAKCAALVAAFRPKEIPTSGPLAGLVGSFLSQEDKA